ncbi:unnamed protein product, partial [Iphiclides podalirius]
MSCYSDRVGSGRTEAAINRAPAAARRRKRTLRDRPHCPSPVSTNPASLLPLYKPLPPPPPISPSYFLQSNS